MKERLEVCAATEKKRLAFGKARTRRLFLESGFIDTKYQQHFEVGGQPREECTAGDLNLAFQKGHPRRPARRHTVNYFIVH